MDEQTKIYAAELLDLLRVYEDRHGRGATVVLLAQQLERYKSIGAPTRRLADILATDIHEAPVVGAREVV